MTRTKHGHGISGWDRGKEKVPEDETVKGWKGEEQGFHWGPEGRRCAGRPWGAESYGPGEGSVSRKWWGWGRGSLYCCVGRASPRGTAGKTLHWRDRKAASAPGASRWGPSGQRSSPTGFLESREWVRPPGCRSTAGSGLHTCLIWTSWCLKKRL